MNYSRWQSAETQRRSQRAVPTNRSICGMLPTGQAAAAPEKLETPSVVHCMRYNSAGTRLAVGGDKSTRIYDAASKILLEYVPAAGIVQSLDWLADGLSLAIAAGNAPSIQPLVFQRSLGGHTGAANSVTFVAAGTEAVSGGADRTVRLWNLTDGKQLRTFAGGTDAVTSVAVTPDGVTVIAGSVDNHVRTWTLANGQVGRDFVHPVAVRSVSVGGDASRIVTAADDNIVRLWDLASGLELERFTGHEANVVSVSLAADNKTILSGSADKSGRLWTAAAVRVLQADPAKVNDLVLSADGTQAITAGTDKTAKAWSTAEGTALRQLAGAKDNLTRLALRPDGQQIAAADAQGRLYLWTYASGALVQTVETGSSVVDLAFSPDNKRIAAAGADGKLPVYDATATEPTLLSELLSPKPLATVAFAPEKTIVTGGADQQISVWADASPNATRSLPGHTGPVYGVAFSPDGKLIASASGDQTIRIWDAAAGTQVRTISGSTGAIYGISFDANGERLVSGGADGILRLWNVANGGPLKQLQEGETPAPLFAVAFSPDGAYAAGAGIEKAIRIWNTNSGTVMKNLEGHTDAVYQLTFNQPGTRLLSCGQAGSLIIWNVSDGQPAFSGNAPSVLYSGTYSRDGSAIAIAGAAGSTAFVAVPANVR